MSEQHKEPRQQQSCYWPSYSRLFWFQQQKGVTSFAKLVFSHLIILGTQTKQGVQRTTTPLSPYISEQRAHSLANRLETVRVSHWPITWPIYLPCTVAKGKFQCAYNIISNSHPFHSKWVDPPIPEIQQFQYFTLKIQGQGHGGGQILKPWCESNIPSTLTLFVLCQWALPFLR